MFEFLKKIRKKLTPNQAALTGKPIEERWSPLQKGYGRIVVRQNPAFIDANGVLLNDLYYYQRGTTPQISRLGRIGDNLKETSIRMELTAPTDRMGEIELVLLQGNDVLTPMKDWIGVYSLYHTQGKVKSPLQVKAGLQIEELDGAPSLVLTAEDPANKKPLTLTWSYPGEYCWEVQDSAYDFLKQVYSVVAFLKSGGIVGYQEEGHWLLPGGVTSAPVKQEQKLVADQTLFQQIRHHLESQTGLVLTQLSEPYAITITELAGGLRHINAFYVAGAIGALTKGLFLDPKHLPDFSAYVDARTLQANFEQFLVNSAQEDVSNLPANIDPVSRRPAGGMEGLFVTSAPTTHNPNGTPCYQMLRFYNDGLVLQAGVCDADIENAKSAVPAWFHRDTAVEVGRGVYYTLDQQIWFTTSAYFTQVANEVTLDFAGIIQDSEHLDISVRDRHTEIVTTDVKFKRWI